MTSPARLFGLILLAALSIWALWELLWSPTPLPAPQAAELRATEVAPADRGLTKPLTDYTATLVRPLFFAGRTPPPAEPASTAGAGADATSPPAATANATRLSLSAVIVEHGERSALLIAAGQASSTRLKVGDTLAGWRLVSIEDDRVTVSSNGRDQALLLRQFDAAPIRPTQVPRAPRAPGGFRGQSRTE